MCHFGRIGNQLPYRKECDYYCATFGRIGNQLLYREECDYCATFGRIGNQLPYRKECDYCATFGRIVNPIGKSVTTVPLLVELVISYPIGKRVTIVQLSVELANYFLIQLLYREVYDYCAAFGSIGNYRHDINDTSSNFGTFSFQPKWQNVMISNFYQLWVFGFGLSYHVPIHHNTYFYQFGRIWFQPWVWVWVRV